MARAADIAQPGSVAELPHWLILADQGAIGSLLAARHRARGGACTLVYPGQAFELIDEQTFRAAPDRPEDFRRLFASLPRHRPHEIIHLWGLEEPPIGRSSDDPATAPGLLSCGSVVSLIQAVLDAQPEHDVRKTCLVTQGGVGGASPMRVTGLAQSGLWGLGRVLATEHPDLNPIRIDLDSAEFCPGLRRCSLGRTVIGVRRRRSVVPRRCQACLAAGSSGNGRAGRSRHISPRCVVSH